MNNKQLSEMIKNLREKKLAEIVGKPPPFNPTHSKGKEDTGSPNQYAHHKQVAEGARRPIISGGFQGKSTLGSSVRAAAQRERGIQSQDKRYLNKTNLRIGEENNKKEVELGPTDTGETGETVTTNPTDNSPSVTGSMNKNTNTKEIKEKKNATMG